MRLDHLLSKEEITFSVRSNPTKTEEEVKSCCLLLSCQGEENEQRTCIKRKQVRLARFERTSPSAANKPGSKLEKTSLRTQAFLVAMRPGVTPVPIPNTMVKTRTADGTALETVWESRWPPNLKEKDLRQNRCRS